MFSSRANHGQENWYDTEEVGNEIEHAYKEMINTFWQFSRQALPMIQHIRVVQLDIAKIKRMVIAVKQFSDVIQHADNKSSFSTYLEVLKNYLQTFQVAASHRTVVAARQPYDDLLNTTRQVISFLEKK